MPVAVSSTKVCGTYVTDIRYREDAADGNKSLGISGKRIGFLSFHFVLLLLF